MYDSGLGRQLGHRSGTGGLAAMSSSPVAGPSSAAANGRRSPTRNTGSRPDGLDSAADLASAPAHWSHPTSSRSNSTASSSHLTEAFAAQLMSRSDPSTSASSAAFSRSSPSLNGDHMASGSWTGPSSSAGLSRPESPRRRAAVAHHGGSSSGTSSRPLEIPRTPSKRSSVQADRYLPTRDDGAEQTAAFQLLSGSPATPHRQKRKMAHDMDAEKEEADHTFANLLGTEIFGRENHAAAAATSTPRSGSSSSAPGSGATTSSNKPSLTAPTTPTKRNLFSYSSPSSSRSRSAGASGGRGSASSLGSGSRWTHGDDTMRGDQTHTGGTRRANGASASSTPRRTGVDGSRTSGLFGSDKRNSSAGTDAENVSSSLHRAYDTSPVKTGSQRLLLSPRRAPRTISKVPFKVLDAPDLADDFYLNLVDWSSTNTLAVGLDKSVYLWSAQDSKVQQLVDLTSANDKVTSLSWAGRGQHLAIGTQQGYVQIWDAETLKLLRTMTGHSMRVGALAWNEHILTSGARDRAILHRDVRVPEHHIRELHGHKQEVCNLEWNTETNQLASGGNDNKLLVWDSLNTNPLHRFSEHTAAVKAIAWSPHQQGILASGGGTADMKIRFWNSITGSMLSEVDTGSQVCNLVWSRTSNELISTHGYSAGKIQNQIQVWRYPSMQQVATLTGHTMRVLYLAMSPDGETIVTGAGDETLRFWDLNTPAKGTQIDRSSFHSGGSLNPFAKLR